MNAAVTFGFLVAFLPTLLAMVLGRRNWVGILMVNLFLGWTGIGWLFAFVWALIGESRQAEQRRLRRRYARI